MSKGYELTARKRGNEKDWMITYTKTFHSARAYVIFREKSINMYNVFWSNIHLCMHWVKICAEGKVSRCWQWLFWRSEDYKRCGRCLFYAFYILCKLSSVSLPYHERETIWKSLSSATVCDPGRASLPVQGHLRAAVSSSTLFVTFQNTGALTWPWARKSEAGVSL